MYIRTSRLFATIALLAVIAPLSANAATLDQLQTQIAALLQQISTLQGQIVQMNTSSSDSGSVTSTTASPMTSTSVSSASGAGDTSAATACPVFLRALSRGASGSDVADLQAFLARDPSVGYMGGATGYFGPATEAALRRWQAAHGVVNSGTGDSTGFGVFGPRSRSVAADLCQHANVTPSVMCPVMQPPLCNGGMLISKGVDANGCSLGFRCEVRDPNAPLVSISSISGPSALATDDSGSWVVNASLSGTENVAINYTALWGDGGDAQAGTIAVPHGAVAMTGTFPHRYHKAGTYTPRFTISDNEGTASRTAIVTVTATQTACPATQPPQCPNGTLTSLGTDSNGCSLGYSCDTTTTACPAMQQPLCPNGTLTSRGTDSNGCTLGYSCVTTPLSISVSPASVAQGSAPLSTGDKLHLSWAESSGATSASADVAIELHLLDAAGGDLGVISSRQSTTGSYDWAVPGPQCDSSGSCVYQTDSNVVYATKLGTYRVVAKLYTPANGCLGFTMELNCPRATVTASATSSSFTITSGPTPTSCTVIDCAAGYHPSGPSCSASQTCVADTSGPIPTSGSTCSVLCAAGTHFNGDCSNVQCISDTAASASQSTYLANAATALTHALSILTSLASH